MSLPECLTVVFSVMSMGVFGCIAAGVPCHRVVACLLGKRRTTKSPPASEGSGQGSF